MVALHSLVLQVHKKMRVRQKRKEDHTKYTQLPTKPDAHFVFGQPAMKLSMHPGTHIYASMVPGGLLS